MKHFISLLLALMLAGAAMGAPTAVTPQELTSTSMVDSTLVLVGATTTPWTIIPTDGVIFPNDERTFVYVFGYSSTVTLTVAAPSATINVEGYGAVSLSNLTIALDASSGNVAIKKIPIRYNSGGYVTITTSAASRAKIKVIRLSKF